MKSFSKKRVLARKRVSKALSLSGIPLTQKVENAAYRASQDALTGHNKAIIVRG